ncbi:energy-coupling factor ABC transporter permease [Clostridium isatidis]|uniref:Cobalamin biosynthesis protein CbiM n=1 Tax=Clostridium isatidis TaxID=182773 RepID=A0A343JEB5_9CLOT|nr:energy-coupling factor ABC transporter permease [Clostridium isatidis]ASW43873.1 cobalamin biosynthesis protein CbiM [Clostridium isatidis]
MHMVNNLISPAVAGLMYSCSTAVAGYSIKKIKLENSPERTAMMGAAGAFVFAAQMVNFTIPGTGSSGHLCGGILLAALLGPYAAFLTMAGILLVQALLFADGGILALGCNIWNIAFYSCIVGGLFIWKPIMKGGVSKKRIIIASIIASIISLQLGAFSVALEALASGNSQLPFVDFISVIQPIHLAIGLVEGFITAGVLSFVYEARAELIWGGKREEEKKAKLSFNKLIAALSATAILTAGALSLAGSEYPDGLEWSISKITGSIEIESSSEFYKKLDSFQKAIAILPDYSLKNSDTAFGTSLSGIFGGAVVALSLIGGSSLINNSKKDSLIAG